MRTGLRVRLSAAFAIGSMAVSAGLALLTYETSRAYLHRQRETSALRQAFVNARLLRASLRSETPDVPRLLSSLETADGSRGVLRHHGNWFGSSVGVGRDTLPSELRVKAEEGVASRQVFSLDGVTHLGVAVPIPAVDALYFEVTPLRGLASTLGVLRNSLLAAAAVTTLLGAGLGLIVSRRVLLPVTAASEAAALVAAGNLDARLAETSDRDLAVLATSFNQMTEALRERIERDRRFVSAVSHELRSPLTTLMAAVEVLHARRAELPERAAIAVDLVASEVTRFDRLVQDLLEISRLDAGAVERPTEEVAIGEFVLRVMSALAGDGRAIPVDVDADALDAVVLADKRRLERVLANLVENAEAYGGGATRVALERTGPLVRLAVEDAGPGIPDEEHERIFEAFVRGRSAAARGSSQGTGLGLSIVAEHVALHGGRVWVEPSDAGGARFVVELPVAPS